MTKLIVKAAARADVLRQVRYLLEQDALSAATRFPAGFQKALDRIVQFPRIGAPCIARPGNSRSAKLKYLRSWPIPRFKAVRIYYTSHRTVIQVLRVLHDRQDLQRHILEN